MARKTRMTDTIDLCHWIGGKRVAADRPGESLNTGFERRAITVEQRNPVPVGQEPLRDRQADSACGAGDHGHFCGCGAHRNAPPRAAARRW